MPESTPSLTLQPEPSANADLLTELLRSGARRLIAQAVKAELETFLEKHAGRLFDGRRAVVRNGALPSRSVLTGIGNVEIQVPKVRDRSGGGAVFHSTILPPYLKRSRSVEELAPRHPVWVASWSPGNWSCTLALASK
jgi:transposase-like protein